MLSTGEDMLKLEIKGTVRQEAQCALLVQLMLTMPSIINNKFTPQLNKLLTVMEMSHHVTIQNPFSCHWLK